MTKAEAITFVEEHRAASKEFALQTLIKGFTDTFTWQKDEKEIDDYFNDQLRKINEKYEGKN